MGDGQQMASTGQVAQQQGTQPGCGPAVEPLVGSSATSRRASPGWRRQRPRAGPCLPRAGVQSALPPGQSKPLEGGAGPRSGLLAPGSHPPPPGQATPWWDPAPAPAPGAASPAPPPESAQARRVGQVVMAATRHHLAPACQRGWQRPHQGMSQQGFARTALPDQGQGRCRDEW